MDSFQDLTRAVTCRYHDKIKRLCTPLSDHLNVSDFWYYKITDSGHHAYLASHAEWNEYFAAEKFYLNFPLLRNPKNFEDGVSLMKALNYKPFSQILSAAQNKFNIHPGVAWMNQIPGGIEGFGFCLNSPEDSLSARLLNELPLLKLFAKKFREENGDLFSKLEDNQIDLAGLMGSTFYEKSDPVVLEQIAREKFLKEIGIDGSLTVMECKVMRLLVRGYSASQIGKQIFRSKRTVEHHLERMKDKLGCDSKAELIQKARELEYCGYFSNAV